MSAPLGKILLRGGLWAASGRGLAIAQVFLFNVVLARLLPPGEFGAWVIVLSLVSLGVTLGSFGLDRAGVRVVSELFARREGAELRAAVRTILRLTPLGGAAAAALFAAAAPWLAMRLFEAPELLAASLAVAVWIFAGVWQRQLTEIFRALQDIRRATIFGGLKSSGLAISLSLLAGLAVLYLAGAAGFVELVRLSAALTAAVAGIAGWTLWRVLRRPPERPQPGAVACRSPGAAGILAIALPLFLIELLVVARTEIDVWLVGACVDSEMVAGFGAAVRLVALVYTPLMVVSAALAPLVAEAEARGGREELERTVRLAATAAFLPALAVAVVLELAAPSLLALIFGEFYRHAGTVLRLLTAGHLINVLAGPNVLVLTMRGRERATLLGMLPTLAVVAVAGWPAGRAYGAEGVAAVSALGLLMQNAVMTWLVRRGVGVWTVPYLSPRAAWGAARRLWGRERSGPWTGPEGDG